jgi:hypothetical protein
LERHGCGSTSEVSHDDFLAEIQQLKDRIAVLERKSVEVLCHQADEIIQHKSTVTQGPTSLEGFHQLDFESIATELQTRAPDLYQIFMALGDTQRNKQKKRMRQQQRR